MSHNSGYKDCLLNHADGCPNRHRVTGKACWCGGKFLLPDEQEGCTCPPPAVDRVEEIRAREANRVDMEFSHNVNILQKDRVYLLSALDKANNKIATDKITMATYLDMLKGYELLKENFAISQAALEKANAENEQLQELLTAARAGKAIGPIVGAQTIVNQEHEIESLLAELEGAYKRIGRLLGRDKTFNAVLTESRDAAIAELKAVKSDRDRYRDALEEIENGKGWATFECNAHARAALKGDKHD